MLQNWRLDGSYKNKSYFENIEISILLLLWWDIFICFYILSPPKLWVTFKRIRHAQSVPQSRILLYIGSAS